ncbi:MAG: calcium-binding protein [Alphaproteobacteria bacterium]|nr:calcium-binding protein [Alphaproteobacteria bacterium]
MTVTAIATESDGDLATNVKTLNVSVAGDADEPSLMVSNVTGSAGQAISLNLSAALTDTDGSGSLSLTIAGIPTGAALSAGTDNGDGTWTLTAEQAAGLKITPAAGQAGDFSLTVTARPTEADGDTATTVRSLSVGIAFDEDQNARGSSANSRINGTNASDTLHGGAGNDSINSGNSDDLVYGGSGNDSIDAGNGSDVVYGGSGDDSIGAGNGNDKIDSGGGDDTVFGGSGDDVILGDNGADIIDGGAGRDILSGGAGADLFLFGSGDGNDVMDGAKGTDTLRLEDLGEPGDWTLTLDTGDRITASDADHVELSNNAGGTIAFADGSTITFESVERIEW